MHVTCKKAVSAILALSIFLMTACGTAQQPQPVVEDVIPPHSPIIEDVVYEPEEQEFETIEEIEDAEPIVLPRGDTELELLIYSFIDEISEQGFRGTAISVFTREGIILDFTYGYKNAARQIPIDRDTVFEWGSITKLLTWISVLQLYEQGRLDLHADLFTYLPREDFPNIIYPTTMNHLMNHTAGFSDITNQDFISRHNFPVGMIVPTFEDALINISMEEIVAQNSRPGKRVMYSNYGAALAAYVVQSISGIPFYEYVHINIFAPLGMTQTALLSDLSDNTWVSEQRDKINIYGPHGQQIQMLRIQNVFYPAFSATGAMSDMVRFAQALLPAENSNSVLFERIETLYQIFPSLEDIQSASECEAIGEISFFNGFAIFPSRNMGISRHAIRGDTDRIIGHAGSSVGFVSTLWIDIDRGIGMAMSENTFHGLSVVEGFFADVAEIITR